MQFLVTGTDGTDEGALERRLGAREAHLKGVEAASAKGEHLYGAALLDDNGNMIGSFLVVEYPDRAALDAWLEKEPYILEHVWEKVEVRPCRVAATFHDKTL